VSTNTSNHAPDQPVLAPHPVIPGYFENEDERRALLERLFNESAEYYDPINNRMSMGSGNRYRKQVLLNAGVKSGMSLLDVGCGTGVIAGHAREIVGSTGRVVGRLLVQNGGLPKATSPKPSHFHWRIVRLTW
jgi:hypothetical protein